MPFSMLGSFRDTAVETVTTSPASWENPGPFRVFLALATVDIYLRRNATTVTSNDLLVPANNPARFVLEPGQSVAFMATASSPDGTIRITELGEDWG